MEELNRINTYQNAQIRNRFSSRQLELPRPCYYLLQVLGMWKPADSRNCFHTFNHTFSWLIWFATIVIMYAVSSEFDHWGLFINNVTNTFNLAIPFAYCRYYFSNGNYDRLLIHVITLHPEALDMMKQKSKIYTMLSLFLWICGFGFFYRHWIKYAFPTHNAFYFICIASIIYMTGCWACWLSIYAFVCQVHKIQIDLYCLKMKNNYGYSSRTEAAEVSCVTNLLYHFHDIREWTERSQDDFSKIISIGAMHHILNITMFALAYFKNEFEIHFTGWLFMVGILFDVISILMKLYPAGVVSQSLHNIVLIAGENCNLHLDGKELPKERLTFYQFVLMREEDMGFYILGVKITSKFAVGLFTTITTAGLTFFYYAKPYLQKIPV